MYFLVKWMKQLFDKSENFDFLLQWASKEKIKKVLEEIKIITLSIKEYKQEASSFWEVYCIISIPEKVNIITKDLSLEDSCKFLIKLGFSISYANTFDHAISDEEIAVLINRIKEGESEKTEQKKKEIKAENKAKEKTFEDKELKHIKEITQAILLKITKIIDATQNTVSIIKITELKKNESILKKMILGRNIKKIKEVLQLIFNTLDQIQQEYYDKFQEQEILIFPQTTVSQLDVVREYEIFKTSKFIKDLKLKPTAHQRYYIFLQKIWFILSFLKRDISVFFSFKKLLFKSFDFLEFIIIVILVEFWLFLWIDHFFVLYGDKTNIYLILIHFSIISIVLFFIKKIRKQAIGQLLFLLWLVIAVSYSILLLIILNFSLF